MEQKDATEQALTLKLSVLVVKYSWVCSSVVVAGVL